MDNVKILQPKRQEMTTIARCPNCKEEFYVETYDTRFENGQEVDEEHTVKGDPTTLAAIAKEHKKSCPQS